MSKQQAAAELVKACGGNAIEALKTLALYWRSGTGDKTIATEIERTADKFRDW